MTLVRDATFELLGTSDRDGLGEGPSWNVADQRLYWVDITGQRVRSSDLNATDVRQWATPTAVGFAVPDDQGQLVIGLQHGLARLDPASGHIQLGRQVDDRPDHRLNDGKTDRAGRLWFGSMHSPETEPSSRFYRVDATSVTTVFDTVITSNGLGWSPDNTTMYYTDSKTNRIRAFDFDAASGTIAYPRVFATDPAGQFVPDGLTVDAEGYVWGAKWGGGRVIRYAPNGKIALDLRFPVARITSCMFAGTKLDHLVVTSARGPADDEPLAGRVFLVDPHTHGIAETPVSAQTLATALGDRPGPQA